MQLDGVVLASGSIFAFTTGVITPAATAAALSAEQAFTVAPPSPLLPGDIVSVSALTPSANAAHVSGARVNATGQLVLTVANPTAGSLTRTASAYAVLVARP